MSAEAEPDRCRACRGTGKVISMLGGHPSEGECPWCEGSGMFIPGHDAQAVAPGAGGAAEGPAGASNKPPAQESAVAPQDPQSQ